MDIVHELQQFTFLYFYTAIRSINQFMTLSPLFIQNFYAFCIKKTLPRPYGRIKLSRYLSCYWSVLIMWAEWCNDGHVVKWFVLCWGSCFGI